VQQLLEPLFAGIWCRHVIGHRLERLSCEARVDRFPKPRPPAREPIHNRGHRPTLQRSHAEYF
jgi:hypothetical protein